MSQEKLTHMHSKTGEEKEDTQAEALVSEVSFIRSYERQKMQQNTSEHVSRKKKPRTLDSTDMLLIIPLLISFASVQLVYIQGSHNNEQYESA